MTPDIPQNLPDDPQARLTALLLGQLPEGEAADLRKQIKQDPELARLALRLKKAIELVSAAAAEGLGTADPAAPTADPLRLSDDRREELLARFKTIRPAAFAPRRADFRSYLLVSAAALFMVLAMAAMLLPSLGRRSAPTQLGFLPSSALKDVPARAPGFFGDGGVATRETLIDPDHALHSIISPQGYSGTVGDAAGQSLWGGVQSQNALVPESQPAEPEVFSRRYGIAPGAKADAVPGTEAGRKVSLQITSGGAAQEPMAAPAPQAPGQLADKMIVGQSVLKNLEDNFGGTAGAGGASGIVGGGISTEGRGNAIAGTPVARLPAFRRSPEADGQAAVVAGTVAVPAPVALDAKSGNETLTVTATEVAAAEPTGVAGPASGIEPAKQREEARLKFKENLSKVNNTWEVNQPVEAEGVEVLRRRLDRSAADPGLARAEKDSLSLDGSARGLGPETASRGAAATGSDTYFSRSSGGGFGGGGGGPATAGKPQAVQGVTAWADMDSDGAIDQLFINGGDGRLTKGIPGAVPRVSVANGDQSRKLSELAQEKAEKKETAWFYDDTESAFGMAAGNQGRLSEFAYGLATNTVALGDEVQLGALFMAEPQSNTPAPAPPAPAPVEHQPEVATGDNAVSTFSLNVSDVSFRLAEASLQQNRLPEAASIRSEEFINAFDYRDPEPSPGHAVGFTWERALYPFAHNREVLRLAVKTSAQGRPPGRVLNLVLLLDRSGSMERADRVQLMREALSVLRAQLQPQDRVSVIAFARTPRLLAQGASGTQVDEALDRVSSLTPEGGTNLEEALRLAYQAARQSFEPAGVNRVILLTDGAANLGSVNAGLLRQLVEQNRRQGIALDCFGLGWEGYNDSLLEELSRNGDGRYGFINTPGEATAEFAAKIAGALQVAASDVKVQVEFNPQRVTAWRQIGYAKHRLRKEQFRDNTVDAAELGAAEAGNGLYVVKVNPRGSGPLGVLRVRYKIPGTTEYREQEWVLSATAPAPALDQAGPAMRLAAAAAAFAEWLAQSPHAAEIKPALLQPLLNGVPEQLGGDPRPARLQSMLQQAASLAGQ